MPTRLPREIQAALAQFMAEAGMSPKELLESVSDAISDGETSPAPKPDRASESVQATLRRVERGLGLSHRGAATPEPAPEPVDAATAALRSLAEKHGIEVKA